MGLNRDLQSCQGSRDSKVNMANVEVAFPFSIYVCTNIMEWNCMFYIELSLLVIGRSAWLSLTTGAIIWEPDVSSPLFGAFDSLSSF